MFTKNQKIALAAVTTALASAALFALPQATTVDTGTKQSTIPTGPTTSTPAVEAPVDMKKVSEAFGHFIGRHLKSPGANFDLDSVIRGLREGSEGKPAPMTDKEYEQMMTQVQKSAFEKVSQENLKAANDYIRDNSKASGIVVVKPEKLQYKIVKEGNGPVVETNGSPQINYTGKFIDGTVFGSSEDSGGPVTIPLGQTIQGFSLGIAGMKEGETRRLYVHPDLGYGTTGHLPPNSLLIFDIEVIKAASPEKSEQSYLDDEDLDEDDPSDDDGLGPLALVGDDKNTDTSHSHNDYDDNDDDDDYDDDDKDQDD
ncbi:MAG: FKBP-type peptidyl-prolyl cis-trans isomerase [Parachlamydiaceae bacterium]|nr:FKBP-type peptidyl-prolyl cis-trans isomerase [Parachlamydiaceae bacterium]